MPKNPIETRGYKRILEKRIKDADRQQYEELYGKPKSSGRRQDQTKEYDQPRPYYPDDGEVAEEIRHVRATGSIHQPLHLRRLFVTSVASGLLTVGAGAFAAHGFETGGLRDAVEAIAKDGFDANAYNLAVSFQAVNEVVWGTLATVTGANVMVGSIVRMIRRRQN